MEIVKDEKQYNSHTIRDMTEGKLLAVKDALDNIEHPHQKRLTAVQYDVLLVIDRYLNKGQVK